MTISRNLVPPDRVEVIPAESVDSSMTGVTVELDGLALELEDLRDEAARLERQAAEARRRIDESNSAIPLLEGLFEEQARATRADLRAALAQAEERARKRLASAHADADRILADASSVGDALAVEAAGPHTVAGGGSPFDRPSTDRFRSLLTDVEESFGDRPPLPGTGVVDAPAPPAERSAPVPGPPVEPEPEPTAAVQRVVVFPPAPPAGPATPTSPSSEQRPPARPLNAEVAVAGGEPVNFAQFWSADTFRSPGAGAKPALLDALLPLIAVVIVVIVVLSWIG